MSLVSSIILLLFLTFDVSELKNPLGGFAKEKTIPIEHVDGFQLEIQEHQNEEDVSKDREGDDDYVNVASSTPTVCDSVEIEASLKELVLDISSRAECIGDVRDDEFRKEEYNSVTVAVQNENVQSSFSIDAASDAASDEEEIPLGDILDTSDNIKGDNLYQKDSLLTDDSCLDVADRSNEKEDSKADAQDLKCQGSTTDADDNTKKYFSAFGTPELNKTNEVCQDIDNTGEIVASDASSLFGGGVSGSNCGDGFDEAPKTESNMDNKTTQRATSDASSLFGGSSCSGGDSFDEAPKPESRVESSHSKPTQRVTSDASSLFGGSSGGFDESPKTESKMEPNKPIQQPTSDASSLFGGGVSGGGGGGFDEAPKPESRVESSPSKPTQRVTSDASSLFGGSSGGGFDESPKTESKMEPNKPIQQPASDASSLFGGGVSGGGGGGFDEAPKPESRVESSPSKPTRRATSDASSLFGGSSGGGFDESPKTESKMEPNKPIQQPTSDASSLFGGGVSGGGGGGFDEAPKPESRVESSPSKPTQRVTSDASSLFGGSSGGGFDESPKTESKMEPNKPIQQPTSDASSLFGGGVSGGGGGGCDEAPKRNSNMESTLQSQPVQRATSDASSLFGGSSGGSGDDGFCEAPKPESRVESSPNKPAQRATSDASSLFGGAPSSSGGGSDGFDESPKTESKMEPNKPIQQPTSDASSLFGGGVSGGGGCGCDEAPKPESRVESTLQSQPVQRAASDASSLFGGGGGGGGGGFDESPKTEPKVASSSQSQPVQRATSDASSLFGGSSGGSGDDGFGEAPKPESRVESSPIKPAQRATSDASSLFGGGSSGGGFDVSPKTEPKMASSSQSQPVQRATSDASSLFGGSSDGSGGFDEAPKPESRVESSPIKPAQRATSDASSLFGGGSSGGGFDVSPKTMASSSQSQPVQRATSDASSLFGGGSSGGGGFDKTPKHDSEMESSSQSQLVQRATDASSLFGGGGGGFDVSPKTEPESSSQSQPVQRATSDASSLFGGGSSNSSGGGGGGGGGGDDGSVTPETRCANNKASASGSGCSQSNDASNLFGSAKGSESSVSRPLTEERLFANSSRAPEIGSSSGVKKAPSSKGSVTSAVPDDLFGSSNDIFSGPFGGSFPPGPNDLFGSPPPSSQPGGRGGRAMSARDVFDRPALKTETVDESAPPSAPGVRNIPVKSATPPMAPLQGASFSPQLQRESNVKTKAKPVKKQQKPSMHPSQMAFASASKSSEPQQLSCPPTTNMTSKPAGTVNRLRPSGPYKPAIGPIASFGFGGRIITFFPGAAAGGQGLSLHQVPDKTHKATRPNPLFVHTLVRLMAKEFGGERNKPSSAGGISSVGTNPDEVRKHELKLVFDLIQEFKGPLSADSAEMQGDVIKFISERKNDPVAYTLNSLRSNSAFPKSEHLLWSLLEIMIRFDGSLSSESSVDGSNTSTPESHIARLLLDSDSSSSTVDPTMTSQEDSFVQQAYLSHLNASTNLRKGQNPSMPSSSSAVVDAGDKNVEDAHFLAQVESLLIRGQREKACELAVSAEQWAIALMIGSMCSKSTFQNMMKSFAEKSFPQQSSLNLLSLLYSNQAENMIRYGGRSLGGSGGSDENVEKGWRKSLAAVLTNKVGDWASLSRAVGDRVREGGGDVMAAQFAYLTAGMTCGKGNFVLLGCSSEEANAERGLSMADLRFISAMRMSEVFEWSLLRGASTSKASTKASSSTGDKKSSSNSLSSFFGLGGAKASGPDGGNDPASSSSDFQSATVPVKRMSPEAILKCRVALCPVKLKYALFLADLGLSNEAASYVRDIKAVNAKVQEMQASGASLRMTLLLFCVV